jgi:hypothetical protein
MKKRVGKSGERRRGLWREREWLCGRRGGRAGARVVMAQLKLQKGGNLQCFGVKGRGHQEQEQGMKRFAAGKGRREREKESGTSQRGDNPHEDPKERTLLPVDLY